MFGLIASLLSQLASSIKENPKLRAAAEELRKAGVQVGDAVSEALKSMEESEVMRAVRLRTNIIPSMLQLNSKRTDRSRERLPESLRR